MALLRALPELAATYGIRPWEVGQLSEPEVERFLDHIAERAHNAGR